MASEISCFVLFGIIIFVNGSPLFKDLTRNEAQYNLKDLVKISDKLGNYNVKTSHHEDRPGNHHEDVAQISYYGQTKGRHNNYDEQSRYADTNQGYNERQPNDNNQALGKTKGIYDFLYHSAKQLGLRTDEKNGSNGSKKDCMKKLGTCIELIWPPSNETSVRTYNDNTDEVAEFLNKLDKELGLSNDNDYENKLEYNNNYNNDRDNVDTSNDNDEGNNANYNQHVRCIGDRCSRRASDVYYNDDDNTYDNRYDDADGNKNILRCSGASCGRSRLPRVSDDVYETDILRCIGDRCSKFDQNDRDSIDSLRCIRDRCMSDDFSESLRCLGNKCSRNRNIDSDSDSDSETDSDIDSDTDTGTDTDTDTDSDTDTDTGTDTDSDTDSDSDSSSSDEDDDTDDDDARMDPKVALTIADLGLNNLRCSGNLCTYTDESNGLRCSGYKCARDRNVDDDGDNVDGIKLKGLRCIGNRCSGDRDDEDDETKAVRCSENKCSRDKNDHEGDSNHVIVKDDELLGHVDTLLTNVLANNLRANSILQDEDVQMLLKERKKILKEVKKIVSQIHPEVPE